MFPIQIGLKQGDPLSPLLFSFALECAIRRVLINQDGLKLNGKHQLVDYADDTSILGGSIRTVKKNKQALVVASKETGWEVYVDKIKYMVMSGDQNTGRSHSMEIDDNSFERVEEFEYLGTALTDQKKKLRADWSQGMLAVIWCRISVFQSAIQKCKD